MFGMKVIKSKSPFTEYLDQERVCLALKGLTNEQYANFQSETYDVLMEVKKNLDKIKAYIERYQDRDYISDIDSFKRYILTLFMKSLRRFPSNFILDVCDELIDNINNNIELKSSKQYSVLNGNMQDIFDKYQERIEKTIRSCFNKSELISKITCDDETSKRKCLAYQELCSKTSNFFTNSPFKISSLDGYFLKQFYILYQQYLRSKYSNVAKIYNEISHKIREYERITNGNTAISGLLDLKTKLAEYRNEGQRIKRKDRIQIENCYEDIISTFFTSGEIQYETRYDKVSWKTRYFINCLKRRDYFKNLEEISYIIKVISDFTKRKSIAISDEIISSNYSEFPESKFLLKDEAFISDIDTAREAWYEASLLNLFFECFKQLGLITTSDEEFIRTIRDNKTTIINYVKSLIEIFKSEEFLGKNIDKNSEEIMDYYEFTVMSRELTEQEVIDNTLKRLQLNC